MKKQFSLSGALGQTPSTREKRAFAAFLLPLYVGEWKREMNEWSPNFLYVISLHTRMRQLHLQLKPAA